MIIIISNKGSVSMLDINTNTALYSFLCFTELQ